MATVSTEIPWSANQSGLKTTTFQPTEDEESMNALSRRHFLSLLPSVVFIAAQIAVGVPGNLLVFFVYLKRFGASSTRVFVLAMAVCDLLTNALSLPLTILHMRTNYSSLHESVCKLLHASWRFPTLMSVGILDCVAFDRRRRVCFPLVQQLTPRQAVYILLAPLFLSSLLSLPFVIFNGHSSGVKDGIVTRECDVNLKYLDSSLQKHYGVILMAWFLVALGILVGCYIHNACKVRQLKTSRQKITALEKCHQNKARRSLKLELGKGSVDSEENLGPYDLVRHETLSEVDTRLTNAERDISLELLPEESCSGGAASATDGRRIMDTPTESVTLSETSVAPTFSSARKATSDESSVMDHANSNMQNTPGSRSELQATCGPRKRQGVAEGEQKDRSKPPAGKQGQQRMKLCSKTTLMMFVLTLTTVVNFVPYIIMEIVENNCFRLDKSPVKMNICMMALLFPYINSVINPFIYSFCNPKFRLQCQRSLRSLYQRARP